MFVSLRGVNVFFFQCYIADKYTGECKYYHLQSVKYFSIFQLYSRCTLIIVSLTVSAALTKLLTEVLREYAGTRVVTPLSGMVTWLIVIHCLRRAVFLHLELPTVHRPQARNRAKRKRSVIVIF